MALSLESLEITFFKKICLLGAVSIAEVVLNTTKIKITKARWIRIFKYERELKS